MTPYDKERQALARLLDTGVISHMAYLEHLDAIDREEEVGRLAAERAEQEVLWTEEDDES